MPKALSPDNIFVRGTSRFHDLLYLSLRDRGLVARDVEHSRFLAFYQGKWAHMGDVNWTTVAMCMVKRPEEKMVAISEDGEAMTYVGGRKTEERIGSEVYVLRGMSPIDGLAYACGMQRQVFKRSGEGTWTAMPAPPPREKENVGFEAIAGFGESEVYAVGWNGEIWLWDGKIWSQLDSPTDLILTGICCAPDNRVYICGQEGTLIRGRYDNWELVELEGISDDFWDVRWFIDKIYLVTISTLFQFVEGACQPIDFGSDGPTTCYRLTDAEGVLWSIGTDDVFSFDGTSWSRID